MTYSNIDEWSESDGIYEALNNDGDVVIEIDAPQNAAECAKWNEPYTAGRAWRVFRESGAIVSGRSANLRAARRDSILELSK